MQEKQKKNMQQKKKKYNIQTSTKHKNHKQRSTKNKHKMQKPIYIKFQYEIHNIITVIIPNKQLLFAWIALIVKKKYKYVLRSKDLFLNIRFVKYKEITTLNSYYRGLKSLTNILSFSYEALSPKINRHFLGELVIAPNLILYESLKTNKSFIAHFAHILIHGFLHLIGYNHNNVTDADNMENIEYSILNKIQLHL